MRQCQNNLRSLLPEHKNEFVAGFSMTVGIWFKRVEVGHDMDATNRIVIVCLRQLCMIVLGYKK